MPSPLKAAHSACLTVLILDRLPLENFYRWLEFVCRGILKRTFVGGWGSRIGQREELKCGTITTKASQDPWVTLKLGWSLQNLLTLRQGNWAFIAHLLVNRCRLALPVGHDHEQGNFHAFSEGISQRMSQLSAVSYCQYSQKLGE